MNTQIYFKKYFFPRKYKIYYVKQIATIPLYLQYIIILFNQYFTDHQYITTNSGFI